MAEKKVPDLFVEQIRLGEATPERRRKVEEAMGSEALRAALRDLEASDEEILGRYPPSAMADLIRSRAAAEGARPLGPRLAARPPRQRSRLASFGVPLALAAAVILCVAFVPRLLRVSSGPALTLQGAERVKGAPEILVYREDAHGAELLKDGQLAREGDVVQIRYVPAGRRFGAIVSIDGRGAVTLHYPESADGTTELASGATSALHYAYRLDDAPGFERFFFVTAPSAFDASAVVGAARRLSRGGARTGSLELPAGFEQTSLLLTKGE